MSDWEKIPIMDNKFRIWKGNYGIWEEELQLAMAVITKWPLFAVTAHAPFNPLRGLNFHFYRPERGSPVRTVAKRLVFTAPAGTPKIGSRFHFHF